METDCSIHSGKRLHLDKWENLWILGEFRITLDYHFIHLFFYLSANVNINVNI